MKEQYPLVRAMGERSILIEFEPEISEDVLGEMLFYKNLIESKTIKPIVEVINSYSSLLVIYPSSIENVYNEIMAIKKLLTESDIKKCIESNIFHLPVCYEEEFGLDLRLISEEKKLSVEEIIKLHSKAVYTVYFIGFLPGFLYLGGMDKRLQISRKGEPRLRVEKGAVGIGEKQTGIYPKVSPGGWQIIGNCPVPIFDKSRNPPCEIVAGDKVKFFPVSRKEHERVKEEIAEGKYELKKEIYAN